MRNKIKIAVIGSLILIGIIISYRIYAPLSIQNFNAVNLRNIKDIKESLKEKETFSFVVLGNIKNSITTFDKKILNRLKEDKPDFIISTGNNVVDSGEGKYRVLYRTLERMDIPFVTGVGDNEVGDEGYKNFYKYFGPFYFSFQADDSYFIFLDTTGHSSKAWQKEWLENQLKRSQEYKRRFVIMNKTPLRFSVDYILDDETKYIEKREDRKYYREIFAKYNVTGVFSSNLELYDQREVDGVSYFVSGGAGGGMILDNPWSFYHYLRVDIGSQGVNYSVVPIEYEFAFLSPTMAKLLENIWIFIQSFLYTNYTTVLMILIVVFLLMFILYLEMKREVDYYREFNGLEKEGENKKFKIAFFTNNYFPFIGGVPISIKRLAKGLRKLGHQVYIFAPQYLEESDEDSEYIIRCKSIYHYHSEGMDLPITNIFSSDIEKKFKELDFDLVHIHHPFWLGTKGLRLAQKYDIPAVLTYHTRLERYSHYIPKLFFLRKIFENRISHYIIKRTANKCDAIFAPTESALEYLRNIGVSRYIKVMPTGIELDNYKQKKVDYFIEEYQNDDQLILLSVSRLSKEKNLYFLMEALKKIKEEINLNFKALMLGDGPEKENLLEFIKENNLEDNIKLLGTVDYQEISKFYLMADIFVFASTSETQGMVLLEAMAGKTPVVAVRSSGIDDVIEDGHNGFKTREDIDQWSKRVIEMMKDEKVLAEMSENALEVAKEHSVVAMAKKASRVYQRISVNSIDN